MSEKDSHKQISPFSVILIMVALSVVGIASIPRLNIQYTPSTTGRTISVAFSMRNASAELIEAEITSRLEGVLSGIFGSTDISSVSRKGSGSITIDFRKGTDMEAARFEVASAIRNIYSSLPDGVSYPEVRVSSATGESGGKYVLSYNLKGPFPSLEIDRYARDFLLSPLSSVKGVEDIALSGATPFHWVITFDALKTAALGISGTDIAKAFSDAYGEVVMGMVQVPEGRMSIRLAGPAPVDFGTVPVKKVGETVFFLRDIATWRYEESSPDFYYRVNGLNTVTLAVSVSDSDNMLTTVKAVKNQMKRLAESFPPELTVDVVNDASEYITKELRKIYFRTGLCILLLLLFVFLVSRSWRYLLIISATLSVNILTAIAIYAFAGLHIHIYTLAGITVSLGIIIDTCIVMVDHYGYWRDRKAFPAIFAAIATTVAALLLVLLLPDTVRANLMDFIWVIVINLMLSLAIAYFFVPSLMTFLLTKDHTLTGTFRKYRRAVRANARYYHYIQWGISHKWVLILLLIVGFGIPTCLLPYPSSKEPDKGYKRIFVKIASWGPYSNNREKIDNWLSSSFGLFYNALARSNFYRRPEQKQLYIMAAMSEGTTIEQMNEVVQSMENYLVGFQEIESFTTAINRNNRATLTIKFKPEHEHSNFPSQLKEEVKIMANRFGGANWLVYGIDQNDFNNSVGRDYKSYGISLKGYNYRDLRRYAETLCVYLSNYRRVRDPEIWGSSRFTQPSIEYNLAYDFGAMMAAGVNPYAYYDRLSFKVFEQSVGSILEEGYPTDVVLRSSEKDSYDLWHILHTPLPVDSMMVTLSTVGSIARKQSGIEIQKKNQSYQLVVCFDFDGVYRPAKRAIDDAIYYMNSSVLPVGYKAENEDSEWNEASIEQYTWLVFLIIAVIFVMLAMTFESLRYPLAVISLIPVSFIGFFLIFGLTNIPFDQGGFAALVMLCGTVVNAGIYIVTTYQRFGGSSTISTEEQIRHYIKAFNYKVIPISLTIISTILGVLPFLSDGPEEVFWFDFAIGTIGGLAFSVLALLFYLPVFMVRKNGTVGSPTDRK